MGLGCGVFFSPFVPSYSNKTKHLSDLTKATNLIGSMTTSRNLKVLKLPSVIGVQYSIRTTLSHLLCGQMPVSLEWVGILLEVFTTESR